MASGLSAGDLLTWDARTAPNTTGPAITRAATMSESHDRFENLHGAHPDWIVERRPCPMCEVKACGCPSEPELLLIPANVVLGEE